MLKERNVFGHGHGNCVRHINPREAFAVNSNIFKKSRPQAVLLASSLFVNLQTAQKAAVKAARAAGKLMRANWHAPKRVNAADAHDIKLELDVRCQKLIEKILRAAFPKFRLLGEEGCIRRRERRIPLGGGPD